MAITRSGRLWAVNTTGTCSRTPAGNVFKVR